MQRNNVRSAESAFKIGFDEHLPMFVAQPITGLSDTFDNDPITLTLPHVLTGDLNKIIIYNLKSTNLIKHNAQPIQFPLKLLFPITDQTRTEIELPSLHGWTWLCLTLFLSRLFVVFATISSFISSRFRLKYKKKIKVKNVDNRSNRKKRRSWWQMTWSDMPSCKLTPVRIKSKKKIYKKKVKLQKK